VRADLNISYRHDAEIAPIICGTVVNGGFKRKLRMVRADYFSMLSVCQSVYFVTDLKQSKAIKKGILANLLKS